MKYAGSILKIFSNMFLAHKGKIVGFIPGPMGQEEKETFGKTKRKIINKNCIQP
jgi:hypothetical protein